MGRHLVQQAFPDQPTRFGGFGGGTPDLTDALVLQQVFLKRLGAQGRPRGIASALRDFFCSSDFSSQSR